MDSYSDDVNDYDSVEVVTHSYGTRQMDINVSAHSKTSKTSSSGPVDLDDFADVLSVAPGPEDDDGSVMDEMLNGLDDEEDLHVGMASEKSEQPRFFHNPNKRLLDSDASLIPGSPFSKPANRPSNRPSQPLSIASYASTISFLATCGWVAFLIYVAVWNYDSVARKAVEVILAIFSFFGIFWNSYYVFSNIFKCFIPGKAFQTNTKYCSILPETKPAEASWLDVTIQIPIYRESVPQTLVPTLQSCRAARDHYVRNSNARCNIVVCDDGLMVLLKDNFAAAEMLWETIVETKGQVIRLSRLLKRVPSASRRHMKGLRSKHVYEAFHRMLYYYHYDIGFVARSTIYRGGKFKKASNLNSHLRLSLGASQLVKNEDEMSFDEALLRSAHNEDGSRHTMFGNDIKLGQLICVNSAEMRMAESVIIKTVPEFLTDDKLGFTQHATKTLAMQRGESFFTNMLEVYSDFTYQGHYLLSSVFGCHPPLAGHSMFLRTEALNQSGKMRTLRKAQRWLTNIGLPFVPVDAVGFSNLQANDRTEFWSENHVCESFELMIHLYNLGFNGRYCAFTNCEFQKGISHVYDEESARHRRTTLGAFEIIFNSFQDISAGHGILSPLFKTLLTCNIPSYYKVYLIAYLCSYAIGSTYVFVFGAEAIARMVDSDEGKRSIYSFGSAGVIIFNMILSYTIGFVTFLVSMLRIYSRNKTVLFPQYRKSACHLVFVLIRYGLFFQILFDCVAGIMFSFLGAMDHLLSRSTVVSIVRRDWSRVWQCTALWDTMLFNIGSWYLAILMAGLAYGTVLRDESWEFDAMPDDLLKHSMFAGPAMFLSFMTIVVPLLLNPYIFGWPCVRRPSQSSKGKSFNRKSKSQRDTVVDVPTVDEFMERTRALDKAVQKAQDEPDVELGSMRSPETPVRKKPERRTTNPRASVQDRSRASGRENNRMDLGQDVDDFGFPKARPSRAKQSRRPSGSGYARR